MKQRFRLYRRKKSGRYYIHSELTGKQESLHTSDRAKATRLLHAQNEAGEQPAINLQIARAYLRLLIRKSGGQTGDDAKVRSLQQFESPQGIVIAPSRPCIEMSQRLNRV